MRNWTKNAWEEESCNGSDEHYLVAAIRRNLLTQADRLDMFNRDISIEEVLNGRTTDTHAEFVSGLFGRWNSVLGWKEFGL